MKNKEYNVLKYSKSCLDAFTLECSIEDLKDNKEARHFYRKLRGRFKLAKWIDKLIDRFYGIK